MTQKKEMKGFLFSWQNLPSLKAAIWKQLDSDIDLYYIIFLGSAQWLVTQSNPGWKKKEIISNANIFNHHFLFSLHLDHPILSQQTDTSLNPQQILKHQICDDFFFQRHKTSNWLNATFTIYNIRFFCPLSCNNFCTNISYLSYWIHFNIDTKHWIYFFSI